MEIVTVNGECSHELLYSVEYCAVRRSSHFSLRIPARGARPVTRGGGATASCSCRSCRSCPSPQGPDTQPLQRAVEA